MHKCEFAFLLSHLKKAIYNLERARALDEEAVDKDIIDNLKQTLILYNYRKEQQDYE